MPRSGDYFTHGTTEWLMLALDLRPGRDPFYYICIRNTKGGLGWTTDEGYFEEEQTVATNERWLRRMEG